MSDSPDLLRDAEVLRKLLTECLRRVARLEDQLRAEAVARTDAVPPAPPLTDPFEQALPEDEQHGSGDESIPPRRQPPPRGQRSDHHRTVRTLHLSATQRPEQAPEPSSDPHAGPAASHRAPRPLDGFGDTEDWDAEPPSGDGSLDPFALLDLSVPSSEPDDAEIYRGMHALLGGLDVTPPDDEA
jgi:hypothetical protein